LSLFDTPSNDPIDALAEAARRGERLTSSHVGPVALTLRAWLSKRRLSPADLDEVVAEAITRLVFVAEDRRLDPTRPAGAWLRVVADHLALDAIRRHGRQDFAPLDEDAYSATTDEDALARLLDASAAIDDIRRALQSAQAQGETTTVTVVTTWLGLAEANGEPPTSRDVASRLGISHMTVQRTLKNFGSFLRPT
jgi:DNA-directed RNA polymerase specialized sigma24 family protein